MTPEQEIKLLKELLYCTKRSCNNCGKVNCENFQRQRIDCCGLWVSYKDYITELENKITDIKANCDLAIEGRDIKIMELEKENAELKADNDARKFAMAMSEKVEKQLREQIEKMKCCYNCSKWNDGECEESPKSKTFFCADFKCDNWEFAND